MRYGKKDAVNAFARLARACGKTIGREPGNWKLDTFPGYRVVEMMENGGECHPITEEALSSREFCKMCHGAIRVLDIREVRFYVC